MLCPNFNQFSLKKCILLIYAIISGESSRRPDAEPQAGPSRMPSVAVAGPSGVHRVMLPSSMGMHRIAVAGPSGVVHRRQPVASSTPAQPRSMPAHCTPFAPNHSEVNGMNALTITPLFTILQYFIK
jgi:hypothetical protein